MTTETMVRDAQTKVAPVERKPAELLNQVVEGVREDCQQEARVYLEESKVPYGGE